MPASSSRFSDFNTADGAGPHTAEKFTPPFSMMAPSVITAETPPPPPGRSHGSRANFPFPSASSNCATIDSCNSLNHPCIISLLIIFNFFNSSIFNLHPLIHSFTHFSKKETLSPHCISQVPSQCQMDGRISRGSARSGRLHRGPDRTLLYRRQSEG